MLDLVIMERDNALGGKKSGDTTPSYLTALKDSLIDVYKPSMIFQQDNTRIHVSKRYKIVV